MSNKVTLVCKQCGQEFEVRKSRADVAQYCSYECANKAKEKEKIDKKCQWCGAEFQAVPSKRDKKYCSQQCMIDALHDGNMTHGMSGTDFYNTWRSMRKRCENPDCNVYCYYGGRGIEVCERWQRFENFYEDMYESYEKHKENHDTTTLDRIDNDGNYRPQNCRWATQLEQMEDQRKLSFEQRKEIKDRYKSGEKQLELAKEFGVNDSTISRVVNEDRCY